LAIIAHAILAILLASGIAATFVGRRANNAVSHGRAWCRGVWHGGPLYHFMNDTISELNGRLASTDYPNSVQRISADADDARLGLCLIVFGCAGSRNTVA
jgi:hypothetical protein